MSIGGIGRSCTQEKSSPAEAGTARVGGGDEVRPLA